MRLKVFVGGSFLGFANIDKQQYPKPGDEIVAGIGRYVIYVVLGEDWDKTVVVGAKAVKSDETVKEFTGLGQKSSPPGV